MTLLITQVAPRIAPQGMLPAPHGLHALSAVAEQAVGLVAHALFSAAGGATYGLARGRLAPAAALPAPVAGVVFGLAVWAAAFEGALPALGVMRRTTDHELARWPAPLVGHSLFGLVCAVVTEKVRPHLAR
jgi:hypothetical protein